MLGIKVAGSAEEAAGMAGGRDRAGSEQGGAQEASSGGGAAPAAEKTEAQVGGAARTRDLSVCVSAYLLGCLLCAVAEVHA